ncbi:MAG: hypothetical protein Q8M03_00680 [Legionella sp.]|nr:hypothetical protein [Legionella sp.]
MNSKITHIGFAGASIGAGSIYAAVVPFPFGLPEIYFNALAPIGGYLGFEFGRWLGTIGYKPLMLALLALLVVPIALFGYDSMLHVGSPGILNNLFVFLLFVAAIFSFATALGVIGFKIEKLSET